MQWNLEIQSLLSNGVDFLKNFTQATLQITSPSCLQDCQSLSTFSNPIYLYCCGLLVAEFYYFPYPFLQNGKLDYQHTYFVFTCVFSCFLFSCIDFTFSKIRLFHFGCRNYVVQFILELKIPSATSKLTSQFEGNYVHLSSQKFSSHVVEKCLLVCNEEARTKIIHELLSAPCFDQLLQDPHANYVVQTALRISEVFLINSHLFLRRIPFPYSSRFQIFTLYKISTTVKTSLLWIK